MNENKLINQGISYEYIKMIEDHAKEYDFVSDKKQFLKSVSPYEQKIILLKSSNPYQVLEYLDELDIKETKRILNELTYDEVKKILYLFSSEDKKKFYAHYSDLELVNQFIVQDKNASEYIDDLTFNRKVELIDSSDSKTIEATSKVYESMTEEQREVATNFISDSDAVSALSVAETRIDDKSSDKAVQDNNSIEGEEESFIDLIKELSEEQKQPEQLVEQKEVGQEIQKEEKQQEEEKIELKPEQKKENIVVEKNIENDELEIINSFQEEKQKAEINVINKIKNELIKSTQIQVDNIENQKTI